MTDNATLTIDLPQDLLDDITEAAEKDAAQKTEMQARLSRRWSDDTNSVEARLAEYNEEDKIAAWIFRAIEHELRGR